MNVLFGADSDGLKQ